MLQAASLSALDGIGHAFFTREGGVSSGIYASLNGGLGSHDAPENVRENRARMASALGVPSTHLVTAYQVHSPDVVTVETPWTRENASHVDALVTRVPGIAIGVSTADCGPVLFADADAGVIGAAHAGWKGALGGVIGNTVAAMERLGAHRARIKAAIGPLIRQPNYEVGEDFVAKLLAADESHARFLAPGARADRRLFDLGGFIAEALRTAGVTQVEDLGLCTYADEARFFSYRRTTHRAEPDYGRHVNAIVLTG